MKKRLVFALALVLGAAVATLAVAQAPSTSHVAPPGYVPGGGDIILGDGCPCASGTPEGEANCGLPTDDTNGGCNWVPYVFGSVVPGETICGTAAVDGSIGFRDTDWYQFEVVQADTYTWTVHAEFPALLGVIDGNAGCPAPSFIAFDTTSGCGDVGSVVLDLTPGTYWFWVGPSFFSPSLACGSEYSATLIGPVPPQSIPAVGQIGLVVIAVLLAGLAFYLLRRRRAATA